jgi:hypothetical protein
MRAKRKDKIRITHNGFQLPPILVSSRPLEDLLEQTARFCIGLPSCIGVLGVVELDSGVCLLQCFGQHRLLGRLLGPFPVAIVNGRGRIGAPFGACRSVARVAPCFPIVVGHGRFP